MIYVVASAQDLHLKQLFKIVELLGHEDVAKRCQHINFGLVLGMSTRRGTVKLFVNTVLHFRNFVLVLTPVLQLGRYSPGLCGSHARNNEEERKQVCANRGSYGYGRYIGHQQCHGSRHERQAVCLRIASCR